MPIPRKLITVVLVSGAAIAAPSAALASPSADAAAAIHKVPCKSSTFNVHYGNNSETCYEGTGAIAPNINNVHTITTGENTGYLCVQRGTAIACRNFFPNMTIGIPPIEPVKLTYLQITST